MDPMIAHPGSTQAINPYSYVENNPLNKTDPTGMAATQQCTGSGSNRTCTTTTTTTKTITPTGSHIPQTTTSKTTTTTVGGKVTSNTTTTSGAGALPGGRVATSVDGNSTYRISARVNPQGPKGQDPQKTTDHTKITGQAKGKDSPAGGGNYQLYMVAELPHEGSPEGHVFIGGITPDGIKQAWGFYPTPEGRDWRLVFGNTVPGIVRDNSIAFAKALSGDKEFAVRSVRVDADTFHRAMSFIKNYAKQNDYNLYTNSCVQAAFNTWHHVGLTRYRAGPMVSPTMVYRGINDIEVPEYLRRF